MYCRVILFSLVFLASALPNDDQLTLASSLIVGRDGYDELYAWNCKVCDSSNKPIHAHIIEEKEKDVKCIITVYSDFIILAFRYTNTALNVWQDILYPLQINQDKTCKDCKVQKAYHNMWKKIQDEVINDLIEMKKQTGINTLFITGISLGGGLSVISYIDINHENIFSTVKVTTYGAPRVGNNKWAAHFNSITQNKTRRYVIEGDPVTVMPTCLTLLCNYGYTGIKIVCHEDKKLCIQEKDEDTSSLSTLRTFMGKSLQKLKQGDVKGIMDHIEGYPKIYNHTLVMSSDL